MDQGVENDLISK